MLYLGIDPGRQGAVAQLHESGRVLRIDPIPLLPGDRPAYDLVEIRALLMAAVIEHKGALFATVERQQPLPPSGFGKGGAGVGGSLANYGRGEASGWAWMLTALQIPYALVRPQTWQARMLAGAIGPDTKARSITAARRRWPDVDLFRTERSRKPSDAFSDALLLAEFGRQECLGGEVFVVAERRA